MINVKQVLFFDEGKAESSGTFRVNQLIALNKEFSSEVEFHTELNNHFDFRDGSGNEIKLLFEKEKVSYIFIHHSFNEPTIVQSNYFDMLRDLLKDKLLVFSGDSYNDLKSGRLRRDDVYNNFKKFMELSASLKQYRLEVFVERNYKRKIAEDFFEDFKKILEDGKENAFASDSLSKLCILLNLDISIFLQRFSQVDELDIIEFIETKIGIL